VNVFEPYCLVANFAGHKATRSPGSETGLSEERKLGRDGSEVGGGDKRARDDDTRCTSGFAIISESASDRIKEEIPF
jgi:hypothetical protein